MTEELLTEVLAQITEGVATLASDGTVVSWNPGAEQLTGYTLATVNDLGVARLFDPPDELQRFLRQGQHRVAELKTRLVVQRADGRRLSVEVRCAPLRHADRTAARAVLVIRDPSETVQKAMMLQAVMTENLALKRQVQDHFAQVQAVGSSLAWRQVRELITQVAPSRATVLITGESGTGKELVATLLHRLSLRTDRPFVTLNTAALPSTLLEAELFGYERGAFTGAVQRKLGRFELADQGTLFLDEIGDMPPELQTKLLRVLQEGTFERLGGERTIRVDVRIIAATNKDLRHEIDSGRFRHDLYYRLNVITIELPSLRQRREDIPLLVQHFIRKYAQLNQKHIGTIQRRALQCLQAYEWPGNVRELEHIIERAVVLTQGATIDVGALPTYVRTRASASQADHFEVPAIATLAEIEYLAITHALARHGGNRQAVARQLGIGVATLYRKLKEYHLSGETAEAAPHETT